MKTQILKIALIALAAVVGVNGKECKALWVDHNGTTHKTSIVSEKNVDNMIVRCGSNIKKPLPTRITVKQGWGCLALENGWRKKDYKVVNENTAILYLPNMDFIGAELGFIQSDKNSFYILGKRGCKLKHNSEKWIIEQKVKGKWVNIGQGVFTYIE